MLLEIKIYQDPGLRDKSREVQEVDEEIRKLVDDMIETMGNNKGIGLAAPQVGVLKRVIVVEAEEGPKEFINPEIISRGKEKNSMEEGCLSFPGLFLRIKRAEEIEVKALDKEGREVKVKAQGLIARIIQHEIDHLEGLLILDKINFLEKWRLKRKLKKYGFNR